MPRPSMGSGGSPASVLAPVLPRKPAFALPTAGGSSASAAAATEAAAAAAAAAGSARPSGYQQGLTLVVPFPAQLARLF